MKCEKLTVLTLTKEEQKAIDSFVNIMREDDNLTAYGIWDMMSYIADADYSSVEENYDYNVIITDK